MRIKKIVCIDAGGEEFEIECYEHTVIQLNAGVKQIASFTGDLEYDYNGLKLLSIISANSEYITSRLISLIEANVDQLINS